MAHRIIAQNRGKGGPTYRAPSHRYKAPLRHAGKNDSLIKGLIVDIEHDPARHAPIALARLEDGEKVYMLATEGLGVGDTVSWGSGGAVNNGNTLPLREIQDGPYVCNLEARPDDGGKFVRSSGVRRLSLARPMTAESVSDAERQEQMVQRRLYGNRRYRCRWRTRRKTIRQGRKEALPCQVIRRKWPCQGVCMNVIDHPFGGGGHQHCGRPKTVSRGTPPGRKVGHIAARRTGKWKK